jgi:preprotein translocase subunit SecE
MSSMPKTLVGPQFANGIVDELKKVTWPTRKETVRLTLVVIGISLIIGLYIGIIDVLLTQGLALLAKTH